MNFKTYISNKQYKKLQQCSKLRSKALTLKFYEFYYEYLVLNTVFKCNSIEAFITQS